MRVVITMDHTDRTELLNVLRRHFRKENILTHPSELLAYECDGYTLKKHRPDAVVFPQTTEDVAKVVSLCVKYRCPVVARGAATSLAGGTTPLEGGVQISLTRMRKILHLDPRNRLALVEPGVLNLELTRRLAGTGFHFAPDPSSQGAATIGGNVATNAGGPHTLKYGVMLQHVAGLEWVDGRGEIHSIGPLADPAEFDLAGILTGSEGTLGIVTKIWCRLTPDPLGLRTYRVIFNSVDDATHAVSDVIAAGVVPAAMELMDRGIIASVEAAFHIGFKPDTEAVLIFEIDGTEAGLDSQQEAIARICEAHGAVEFLEAATAQDREMLWKCRKLSVGSVGRLRPNYVIQDGVVPRTQLPEILRRIAAIAEKYQVLIVNVAHAGDGNVHPIVLFDEANHDEVARIHLAGQEILTACMELGGSVTAEHGIGVEKIDFMDQLFAPNDLNAMRRIHKAFDPHQLFNPGKLIPKESRTTMTQEVKSL